MREKATTLLDLIAVLAVATGLAGGLWPVFGFWALCFAGILLLFGSAVASASRAPQVGDKA